MSDPDRAHQIGDESLSWGGPGIAARVTIRMVIRA